jgi:predicted PurR-regulated permease PerM
MTVVGVATIGLFVIALLFALDVAAPFFIPVILAHLLDRLLSPLVRTGKRFGLPFPLGAGLVIAVFFGFLGVGGYYLSGPATEWIESAPRKIQIAEYKLRGLTEPLEKMRKAANEMGEATRAGQGEEQTVTVQQEGSVGGMLMSQTWSFISGLLITIFLLYFLLASGELLLKKLVHLFPQFQHRKNAVKITRSIERDLSQYLGMICLINLGLGIAVAGAMYMIGMPNPLLWGALAGMLNFIPYLGPVVNIAVVGLVAFVSFEHVGYAVLAPLAYLILNGIEASLVTPTVMGWRLQLNPVVIFIALTFWTWIWGIPGALLAVPILAAIKITCDRIQVLKPIGDLLGK